MSRAVSFLLTIVIGVAATATGDAAAQGINWEGGVTAVYQEADDNRVDDEWSASLDIFGTLRHGNGEWLIYIEGSTAPDANGVSSRYPTANADAGSVIDRDGDDSIQISELNYTFELKPGRTLMLGIIDPSAWLDRSRATNDENLHFLNGSFVNNATIEFPDYTPGGVLRWLGDGRKPEVVLLIASSDGIADLPDRSYQELLDLTAGNRGVFAGAGLSWLREHTSARVGAWIRTDDHEVSQRPDETDMNFGVYGVFGWQAGGHVVNARVGVANDRVSVATGFMALAYERQLAFGLFGAGIARTFLSDDFRQADLADTTDAEIFFRIPVAGDTIHLTPSIQYLRNPGFDASGSTADSSAIVAGLRFRWNF